MAISNDRRKERRIRWQLFLVVASLLGIFCWDTTQVLFLPGICIAALILLQDWSSSKRVPILAYHSISDCPDWLGRPNLSVSTKSLDLQLQWLKSRSYDSLSLDDFLSKRTQGELPQHPIVITFDDGYLDNWVAAEPLLRKHKMRGTIYVSTQWIETGTQCRPQMYKGAAGNLKWRGYLNRVEIRSLANGDVLDIQSHAASHDRLFCAENIAGFVTPTHKPLWLRVLQREEKYNWYKPGQELLCGFPIFASGEALAVQEFYPDPGLIKALTIIANSVSSDAEEGWQSKLETTVQEFKASHRALGRMESAEETTQRWKNELEGSKTTLEEITGKPIQHLCWPRDAYCEETRQLAFAAGYHSLTAGNCSNQSADNPHLSRIYIEGCGIPYLDLAVFAMQILLVRGHIWIWPLSAMGNRLVRLLHGVTR